MAKAQAPKVPLSVVTGDTFIWNSRDPEVGTLRIPLKFKGKHMTAVLGFMVEGGDNAEALMAHYLMLNVWPQDVQERAGEADVDEMMAIYNAWQEAFEARRGATFPES